MPPNKNDGCRFDDSEFRKKVEDFLWTSENSLLSRVKELEARAKWRDKWGPIVFTAGSAGLFALLKIITDLWAR